MVGDRVIEAIDGKEEVSTEVADQPGSWRSGLAFLHRRCSVNPRWAYSQLAHGLSHPSRARGIANGRHRRRSHPTPRAGRSADVGASGHVADTVVQPCAGIAGNSIRGSIPLDASRIGCSPRSTRLRIGTYQERPSTRSTGTRLPADPTPRTSIHSATVDHGFPPSAVSLSSAPPNCWSR